MDSSLYRFDVFCLDPKQRKLLFRDRAVQLSSRAFEILLLLVRAFEYLEKAFMKCDTNILLLRCDPSFANIRDDHRFAALLRKLNL